MTNSFASWFDAKAVPIFKGKGQGNDATYYSADGLTSGQPCEVLVDKGLTLVGNQGQAINDQVTITAYLKDIGCVPEIGSRFEIGCELFTVDSLATADESRVVCIVKPGS